MYKIVHPNFITNSCGNGMVHKIFVCNVPFLYNLRKGISLFSDRDILFVTFEIKLNQELNVHVIILESFNKICIENNFESCTHKL